MNLALAKILANDIPTVPEHWHEVCECVPTVAYLRVSKVGNRTKIVSPQIQLNEIIADAKRNGRRIVKILFDINKSGQDFDREAFREVIEDVKAGTYKHVSVWKWSRFGRTNRGSIRMLAMLEEVDGIVDSASEPYDHESVFGEFTRDQMILIADLQGKVFGETWRGVHATRRENLLPHTGQTRFGYDYISSDERNKRYEINPDQARILKWAYESFVAGMAMRKIVVEVNAQGFTTPYGNPWTWQGLAKMMDTGFASGQIRSRSTAQKKAMKRKPANTRRSYDQWDDGKHTPIISRKMWNEYLRIRDEGLTLPPRFARGVHELSSLLFCGICARRLTTKYGGRNRQHSWVCLSQASFHPDRAVSVGNTDALEVLREWLTARSQPEWIESEARRLYDASHQARPAADRINAELKKTDAQAQKALKLYYLAADSGSEATATRVLADVNALDVKMAGLRTELAKTTQDVKLSDWQSLGVIVERWDEFGPEVHNAALRKAIGMVVVSPRSAPRVRRDLRERVKVVPRWEMDEWSGWLSARRQRST